MEVADDVIIRSEEDWTQGYVTETEYTQEYYSGLNPHQIAFSGLLRGVKTTNTSDPFTYFELGCGNGFASNVMAAANPHATFYANDFNPNHIQNANTLKEAAKLTNVTFLEKSFEQLLSMDLPQLDFISLHGVYTWVSRENRNYIVQFIKTHLKPGGMVYVSYNCLPGFATFEPVRRVMTYINELREEAIQDRMDHAFNFIKKLNENGAQFFDRNPRAADRLEYFEKRDTKYLAHELFNRYWTLFNFNDVKDELAQAGVEFVALGGIVENFPQFMLREPMLSLYRSIKDQTLQELTMDIAINRQFRIDIYQKDVVRLDKQQHIEMFMQTKFALTVPRDECALKTTIPAGDLEISAKIFNPIYDELAKGARTLSQIYNALKSLSAYEGHDILNFVHHISKLVAIGGVLPVPQIRKENHVVAKQFNNALLQGAAPAHKGYLLVSPVLGSAIRVGFLHQDFIRCRQEGIEDPAAYIWEKLRKEGKLMAREGKGLKTPEENLEEINSRLEDFNNKYVAYYKMLGII